jgi:pimeloyl-ACP methyl ester carboxylesterase
MDASEGAQRFAHEWWPYEPKFKRVNGWRMHYIDEGVGDPVSSPSRQSGMGLSVPEVREAADRGGRRVIVPDMIGFGLSEKPVREQAHSLGGEWRVEDLDATGRLYQLTAAGTG